MLLIDGKIEKKNKFKMHALTGKRRRTGAVYEGHCNNTCTVADPEGDSSLRPLPKTPDRLKKSGVSCCRHD